VSIEAVLSASAFIEERLDHRLPSRYYQATRGRAARESGQP
jgi:hypothetical protein